MSDLDWEVDSTPGALDGAPTSVHDIPTSRRDWTALMARLGIRPNKGLGQNFLFERGIVQRMVRLAGISADDTVVEVGPGLGILTDELLLRSGRVIAIELDRTLAAHLTAQFGPNPKFSLHPGDALRIDLNHVLDGVAEYKLAANLPYGVASAVIRRFLEADKAPSQLTVMLQLEVAERLVATPPNMTILSVATQFYSVPRIAFHVPPTVFIPPPNVESAVAILEVRPEPLLQGADRDLFFKIVNAGFRQKRKQVANSISAQLDLPKAKVSSWLTESGVDPMRRAQTLTVEDWIGVTLTAPARVAVGGVTALTLQAPAKLNLGLAITGRRPDGYHNLVTIFQAIDIIDTLEMRVPDHVREPSWTSFTCSDPALETQDNLVVKTVEAVRAATGCTLPVDIRLRKAIPTAAGLGGASSNAAATLHGLDKLWSLGLSPENMATIATRLGSDVPFFLRGGCALGEGTGEILRPLAAQAAWYVVVFPKHALPFARKTAAMFGALRPDEIRSGEEVAAQASRLDAGLPLDPALLANVFERPLYNVAPELQRVKTALQDAGAAHVAITGAGPTHFTVVTTQHEANRIARAFVPLYTDDADVFVCRSYAI